MEAVIVAFALGAGAVAAVKHGRRALRSAVGWTAEKTGYITGRGSETLAEARRVARERYELGKDVDGRTEIAPPSTRAPEVQAVPNGTHGNNGGAISRP